MRIGGATVPPILPEEAPVLLRRARGRFAADRVRLQVHFARERRLDGATSPEEIVEEENRVRQVESIVSVDVAGALAPRLEVAEEEEIQQEDGVGKVDYSVGVAVASRK